MLRGKKILLGVCGSIAAYKSAVLVRLLKKSGAEVQVIMTNSAKSFITPLTLSTLSTNPALSAFQKDETGLWNNHVELGLWADLILIAPATANTMAKMASGITDNLLNAVYLSARCPVVFAPAMDLDMYQHPSIKQAIKQLSSYGNLFIDAEHGELASGLIGTGRMAEPEHIIEYLNKLFASNGSLQGKKVLITAGPTYEPIDPVRYIGNHSSGKMGLEIGLQAKKEGAEVVMILGPNSLPKPLLEGITVIDITTAQEMYQACEDKFDSQDIVILAAAVADYTPSSPANQKIKKSDEKFNLAMSKTIDIAQTFGAKKKAQLLIGFALETENEIENAQSKLQKKNLDFIVLNSLSEEGAGFKHDTNKITIIDSDNNIKKFELKTKSEVAKDIINEIAARLT
ncbi:MAG: bifunctional phosphopantothenoylcysteine decarboxylase/phosphopantothenate--cysteine ligase CoaBC [Bacteroidetes bacterium]|nr:MAG: bifunctional phosphopantothenoylcysteine decarboxylase/phosphopantothenate--cysteine ligase CoaBC [Bacteroidota bacterium]